MLTIDLHGKNRLEVQTFLDAEIINNYNLGIRILHVVVGNGSGAVREEALNIIQKHAYVEDYKMGMPYQGGLGVVIIYLKKRKE